MTTTKAITLVTCARWPSLFASDAALAEELTLRGHRVTTNPWNDAPLRSFTNADIVVLRANWDYHHDMAAFEVWLGLVEASDVALHNSATLVRDYLDKSYLERLSAQGFPTPLTGRFDGLDDAAIIEWVTANELDQFVIKPAWGASGHHVDLVRTVDLAAVHERWKADGASRPVVIQELLPQIHDGERSLVFFDGQFSHGLLRRPAPGDFRANSGYGGTMSLAVNIEPAMIELGKRVLDQFPIPATYARIDMVGQGNDLVLLEVEVNEPSLGLHLAPGSAARFADALLSSAP